MPYIIRSKSKIFLLRDGKKQADPVYEVGPDKWVPFETLPSNTSPTGDHQQEVREVDSLDAFEKPVSLQEKLGLLKEPEPAEPEPEAKEPESATLAHTVDPEKLEAVIESGESETSEALPEAPELEPDPEQEEKKTSKKKGRGKSKKGR